MMKKRGSLAIKKKKQMLMTNLQNTQTMGNPLFHQNKDFTSHCLIEVAMPREGMMYDKTTKCTAKMHRVP